jgi:hypothetical protein
VCGRVNAGRLLKEIPRGAWFLMRALAAVLPFLFLAALCRAQAPQVTRVDVTDYGVYSLDPQPDSQTSIEGLHQRQVANVRLFEQKRIIFLKKGVHFGFHYTLVGSPQDAPVPLRMVTIFPAAGLHNPAVAHPLLRSEFTVTQRIGDSRLLYHGIALDYDWALVPGNWTLEIWCGQQRLASEVFLLR